MGVVFNVINPRVSRDGRVMRKRYQGGLPVSISYGLYLSADEPDISGNAKVYFLMSTYPTGGGADVLHPSHIRSNLRLPLDVLDFSKKFLAGDDILESLKIGSEYWFAYISEPVSSLIDGKQIIYEKLTLLFAADQPGPSINNLKSVFDGLYFSKLTPPVPSVST